MCHSGSGSDKAILHTYGNSIQTINMQKGYRCPLPTESRGWKGDVVDECRELSNGAHLLLLTQLSLQLQGSYKI